MREVCWGKHNLAKTNFLNAMRANFSSFSNFPNFSGVLKYFLKQTAGLYSKLITTLIAYNIMAYRRWLAAIFRLQNHFDVRIHRCCRLSSAGSACAVERICLAFSIFIVRAGILWLSFTESFDFRRNSFAGLMEVFCVDVSWCSSLANTFQTISTGFIGRSEDRRPESLYGIPIR